MAPSWSLRRSRAMSKSILPPDDFQSVSLANFAALHESGIDTTLTISLVQQRVSGIWGSTVAVEGPRYALAGPNPKRPKLLACSMCES
jgi:hypothetical protein